MPSSTTQMGDVVYALELANAFRRMTGFPQVDALVPGKQSEPRQCVLARTFNVGCYVSYVNDFDSELGDGVARPLVEQMSEAQRDNYDEGGIVIFDSEAHARAFAGESRMPMVKCGAEVTDEIEGQWNDPHAVALTDDVTWIAKAFDRGDYEEYDEDVLEDE